jgi:hypothetical protein
MSEDEEQPQKPDIEPVAVIHRWDLANMLRGLCNAAMAIKCFNNRQNYGPAIQQLILDLGELTETFADETPGDIAKLTEALSEICDLLDAEDFQGEQHIEFHHGGLYIWDPDVSSEKRQAYLRWRYSYDPKYNPPTQEPNEVR